MRAFDAMTASRFGAATLEAAQLEVGRGESEGNNRGHNIRRYMEPFADGSEWCAGLVSYCLDIASMKLGVGCPVDVRNKSVKRGAKALTRALGRVGTLFTDPAKAMPGDLVCWNRGLPGSWQGHVGIVVQLEGRSILTTIEGNTGSYPSLVRRLRHDITKERLYRFATVRKFTP